MSNKDLMRNPKTIDNDTWWYEENKGIEIYHRTFNGKGELITKKFLIPWSKVESALSRKKNKL